MIADSLLVWLFVNWYWLIVLGLLLSIAGTLYISAGFLDADHKLLSSISQGFSFAIITGIVVGLGFGIIEGLPYSLADYTVILLSLQDISNLLIIHFFLGLLSGLIYGFMFGFVFWAFPIDSLWHSTSLSVVLIVKLIVMLFFIMIALLELQFIFIKLPNVDDPSQALTFITECTFALSLVLFLFSKIWFDDFRKILLKINSNKPYVTWHSFLFWNILVNLVVVGLSLYIAWRVGPDQSTNLGETLCFLGLSTSMLIGRPHLFITQPKALYRLVRDKRKQGVYVTYCKPIFNRRRFTRGYLVGLTFGFFFSGGISRIASLFGGGFDLNLVSIEQAIVCGLVIGLLYGCLYGLGPVLTYRMENLSERNLGQIGLILTVLGFIVAILPTLLN